MNKKLKLKVLIVKFLYISICVETRSFLKLDSKTMCRYKTRKDMSKCCDELPAANFMQ